MITYEERLNGDLRWAFMQGSLHFERNNEVHKTLARIVGLLQQLGLPYAILGDMAMFYHGYRRFTEVIDILVTQESLKKLLAHLEAAGDRAPFMGSKRLRDTDTGVRIEFLVAGEYPGDGKPKPIAFPDPEGASVEIEGTRILQVPHLVELKLASGMTGAGRKKDIGDVQELIRFLKLPRELADQLDASVADKYRELWDDLANADKEPT